MGKRLRPEELQVLQMISEGMTRGTVARKLRLNPSTVSHRIQQVHKKLGTKSTANAVAYTVLTGDIPGPLVCDGHE